MSSSSGDKDSIYFTDSDDLPIFKINQRKEDHEAESGAPQTEIKPEDGPSDVQDANLRTAKLGEDDHPSTSKGTARESTVAVMSEDENVARRTFQSLSDEERQRRGERLLHSKLSHDTKERGSLPPVNSDSDSSDQHHSREASHTTKKESQRTFHEPEAFLRPLKVRKALTNDRIRKANLNYQSFDFGKLNALSPETDDEKAIEEEVDESSVKIASTSSTKSSGSTPLSSNFVKNHSKESIRAERLKHHLVHEMMKHKSELQIILYRYSESRMFKSFIFLIILLNTLSIGFQTVETISVRAGWYLEATDNVFFGIYLMEAVIKIYVWRKHYFSDSWNILDFCILVFNIVDYFLPIIVQNVKGFDGATIFRVLRILRAFRAIRSFKVLRTIKFLSNLTIILNTCLQSVQSMGAIGMLMGLFMYMFAVIGRGLYATKDPERFGSLASTVFTLFQLLTLDGWFSIYTDMIEKSPGDWPIIIYLILYIFLEYFVFLNLFVAVLVDNFQLSLDAANEAKKANKKVLVDSDDEEDRLEVSDSGSSDITGISEVSIYPARKTTAKVYSQYSEFTQDHLTYYFQLLTALEYNTHIISEQKKTLDMLVDLCMETNDDAGK